MIGPAEIRAAHTRINPHLRQTPSLQIEPGALCDGTVGLKLELFQHTGSFKVRGALNTLLANPTSDAGVVAVSGGNHGAAVAFAATKLGARSTIFVPQLAGPVKLDRMRGFGAEVIVSDLDFITLTGQFRKFAKETGALAVHPFNDPLVMAGQGTVAQEIEQQLPELDTLFVSVGGGGLIGGVAAWYGNRIKIIAVESEGTPTFATVLKDGPDTEITVSGIAASSLGSPTIGSLSYDILNRFDVPSIVVPDHAIIEAGRRLWDCARIICEPGAATALAPLTSGVYVPKKDERVGVLICGGNASPDWFL